MVNRPYKEASLLENEMGYLPIEETEDERHYRPLGVGDDFDEDLVEEAAWPVLWRPVDDENQLNAKQRHQDERRL